MLDEYTNCGSRKIRTLTISLSEQELQLKSEPRLSSQKCAPYQLQHSNSKKENLKTNKRFNGFYFLNGQQLKDSFFEAGSIFFNKFEREQYEELPKGIWNFNREFLTILALGVKKD